MIPPRGPVRRSFLFYAIAFSRGIRQEQGRFSASGRLLSPHFFHQYDIIRFHQSGQRTAAKKAVCLSSHILSLLRDYLKPVVVGIVHEVDVHLGVFVADAAHLFMAGMGSFVIIDLECQVKFIVSEIVRFLPVSEPCQFQLVRAVSVFQIDDDKAPVFRIDPPDFMHVKRSRVELQTFVQVENVEIIMNHPEFHYKNLLFSKRSLRRIMYHYLSILQT